MSPKPHYEDIAVAIKYAFGVDGEAPTVVAAGRGFLARRILETARQNNIPVREERELAESLVKIPVGTEIPAELWETMAEVLAHLYKLDGSMSDD
jgi:flagellar biosynthesis protein